MKHRPEVDILPPKPEYRVDAPSDGCVVVVLWALVWAVHAAVLIWFLA